MHPVLRLIRAGNAAVSFVGTAVAALAAEGTGFATSLDFVATVLLASGSTFCVTAAGNVLNDVTDRDSDRVNHPDRPLVTGEVGTDSAKALVVGLFVLGGALIAPVVPGHPLVGLVFVAAVAALVAYELGLKARGLAGNAAVGFLTAAVFLYGGAAAGPIVPVLPLAAMAFGATLSREIIKDMEDAAGDVGRSTLPRVHGMALASLAARGAVAAALALSPIPLLVSVPVLSVAGIMYLGLVVAADALFVLSVADLPARLHREQSLSKGAMTVALLAFLALAFR